MSVGLFVFMGYYIYILYSETSDIYYVGYSDDFKRRFKQHNHSDNVTFTSKHRPWTLKAVYSCGNKQVEAMKIEKFIKSQKSRRLIEKLVAGGEFTGILAQLVRVQHMLD
jgi:putative endonuclease